MLTQGFAFGHGQKEPLFIMPCIIQWDLSVASTDMHLVEHLHAVSENVTGMGLLLRAHLKSTTVCFGTSVRPVINCSHYACVLLKAWRSPLHGDRCVSLNIIKHNALRLSARLFFRDLCDKSSYDLRLQLLKSSKLNSVCSRPPCSEALKLIQMQKLVLVFNCFQGNVNFSLLSSHIILRFNHNTEFHFLLSSSISLPPVPRSQIKRLIGQNCNQQSKQESLLQDSSKSGKLCNPPINFPGQ